VQSDIQGHTSRVFEAYWYRFRERKWWTGAEPVESVGVSFAVDARARDDCKGQTGCFETVPKFGVDGEAATVRRKFGRTVSRLLASEVLL